MQSRTDFSIAYAAAARQLFDAIDLACEREESWPAGVRAAIGAALALFAAEPSLGRLLVFEAYAEGLEAQLRHEATLADIAERLRAGREEPSAPALPDALEEGMVGGVAFIIGRSLRDGRSQPLPALVPELTALVLTPYLGRDGAERFAGLTDL